MPPLALTKPIQLLILDVDGILTNGTFWVDANGHEYKAFHTLDGYGIKALQKQGITVAVISGRKSVCVENRLQELGVTHYFLGVDEKLPIFYRLLKELNLTPEEVAYMGDDIPDLAILERVALKATVQNAVPEVLHIANFIATRPGGFGAVRELCDAILKTQETRA